MKNRLRIWPVALLAAVVVGNTSHAVGARLDGNSAVVGRQQVRAWVAAAMADGKLTEKERSSILLQAENLLSPAEFCILQQTFSRVSARGQSSLASVAREDSDQERAEKEGTDKERAEKEDTDKERAGHQRTEDIARDITRTGLTVPDAAKLTETASHDLPSAPDAPESPFKEEEPEDGPGVLYGVLGGALDDTAVIFEDEQSMIDGFHSLYVGGCRQISLTATVDAFRGPMDLYEQAGNFGFQFGINGGFLVAKRLGVGVQAGTSAVLSDLQGTPFTGSTIRAQNFTTVGMYQRIPRGSTALKWGFAFDFLFDDYYSKLELGQWRVKLGYELDPWDEIGIWACIPNDGDTAPLGGEEDDLFKPVAQGNFYHRRCWENGASTTAWVGLVEEPGEFVFGGDARIPISCRLALIGNFNYVIPAASGAGGQDEEMWNVSLGVEFTPGRLGHNCRSNGCAPLFPLANNGTFAIRRY